MELKIKISLVHVNGADLGTIYSHENLESLNIPADTDAPDYRSLYVGQKIEYYGRKYEVTSFGILILKQMYDPKESGTGVELAAVDERTPINIKLVVNVKSI